MTHDDVLIIGSGVAALQLAIHLNKTLNVRIITKSTIRTANSYLAQGGVAAAIGADDHPSKHVIDTLKAGRFYNNRERVQAIINEAPALIREIADSYSVFDTNKDGELLLGMEGAHSERRIVHAGGDAIGKNVVEFLISQLGDNITIEENVFAYELLLNAGKKRCVGVKAKKHDGEIQVYAARSIILATGGCGRVYRYTSNAKTVTGDGIVMAYRAGAEIVDMEFVQFHPTMLYIDGKIKGLVSEAVRGEGAILVTEDGKRIMEGVHPLKDLAPRHIVSQTIYDYLSRGEKIYLDIHHIQHFAARFPSITEMCIKNGIEVAAGKLPVAPGSHFLMGGIKTDLFGRTSLEGLFAIGEAACTGLHGANRLASNSILEGLYMGKKLSGLLNAAIADQPWEEPAGVPGSPVSKHIDLPDVQILQELMMERVGIVRTGVMLEEQENWLSQFKLQEVADLDSYSARDIEKIFMYTIAELITKSAILRTESRGGHYRSDYPKEDDHHWLKQTITHKQTRGEEKKNEQIQTVFAP